MTLVNASSAAGLTPARSDMRPVGGYWQTSAAKINAAVSGSSPVARTGGKKAILIVEADIRRVFKVSLWLKGLHSLAEVLGGLALAFVGHDLIIGLASALTRAELLEDPGDRLANALRSAAEGLTTDAQAFAAWYLFSHGVIKLVLVIAVLANRVWAYPVFIAAMIGFILYQVYRMTFGVSFVLVAITALDLIVLILAWHEYGFVRRERMRDPGL